MYTLKWQHSSIILNTIVIKGKIRHKRITVIVVRLTASGLAESKPCCHCIRSMRRMAIHYPIDKIVYSGRSGLLHVDRIACIQNRHVTLANRKVK
jgi:hypothetical protein